MEKTLGQWLEEQQLEAILLTDGFRFESAV